MYVLDPKTNVFCRDQKDPATLSHEQLTHSAKIVPIVWLEIAKMPPKFQPNLSAQAQKFRIFDKKLSLDVRCPCLEPIEGKSLRFQKNPVFVWFSMFVFT